MKFLLSRTQDRLMTGNCGNVVTVSKGACLKEIQSNSGLDRVSIGLVELPE